jgi:mono/diheme cytochrome c family protein
MKQSYRFAVIGIALLSLTLAGCGLELHPSYSEKVKYGVRIDPILVSGAAPKLGEETDEVDRPNTLPIMKFADALMPEHPYYSKREELDEKLFRDPGKIIAAQRQQLDDALVAAFGTPAAPKVKAADIDQATIDALKLDDATLAKGSARYRIHCVHCHGVPGDGRGPTARWINPHPRDFRLGLFKFQSVDQATDGQQRKPSRTDLMHTVRRGIEGTAMPSFALLPDDELEWLVSYVIHLAIRGQVEVEIIRGFEFVKESNTLKYPTGQQIKDDVPQYAKIFADKWVEAQNPKLAIRPPAMKFDLTDMDKLAASAQRGQQFFTALPSPALKKQYIDMFLKTAQPKAQAAGIDAKVAKEEANRREAAKKANPKLTEEELNKIQLTEKERADIKLSAEELDQANQEAVKTAETQAISKLTGAKCVSCHSDYGRQARFRYDEWGTLVRPNNLATGQLRGGKRPVDIYYRIHSGINGSGMTPFGTTLSSDEIWDLVNFVTNLSYPHMRERLGIRID